MEKKLSATKSVGFKRKSAKLPSDIFEEFDRQVARNDVPVFYYGKPLFENKEELPDLSEDSGLNTFEKKCVQKWKFI